MRNKPIYILLDFSCGRFYTHHASYIQDYEKFLLSKGEDVEIWVNNSADSEVLRMFTSKVKPILRSTLYSHTRKSSFKSFATNRFVTLVLKARILNEKFPFLMERSKEIVSYFYLRNSIREIGNYSKQRKPVRLIFPTVDALGIRLAKSVLNKKTFEIDLICMRFVGAEARGAFGLNDGMKTLNNLVNLHRSNLRIGFEVKSLQNKFLDLQKSCDNTFWAPMPSVKRSRIPDSSIPKQSSALKIGFIGSARKNKGFDKIPEIIVGLKKNYLDFHAFIQKPNFEWDESKKTLGALQSQHSDEITLIEGASTKEIIDSYISHMDLLILPYNLDDYRFAGSGILFIASDFEVPIATYQELAFAWDVETYDIGITYSEISQLIAALDLFETRSFRKKIATYNKSRNAANIRFLL